MHMNAMKRGVQRALLVLVVLFSVQSAWGFYDPSAGRWINRDPMGERGGLNLYAGLSNNSINAVDPWGLYEMKVKNCEVVILYGHGSAATPHTFNFGGNCSAGHFVGCESKPTNDKIPPQHRIPGAPSTDGDLNRGPGNRDDPDTSTDKFMDDSWAAGLEKAKSLCNNASKCCNSVTVRTELAGSKFHPDNWPFPSPRSQTVNCK